MLSEPLIKIFCFNPVLFSFKVKDLYKIICFVLVKLTFTGKWYICTQEVGQLKHKTLLEPVSSYLHKLRLWVIQCESVSCSVMSNCLWPPWTVAFQAPLSMEFSKQECWSRLPFSSTGGLPNPGIEPESPVLQADSLLAEPTGKSWVVQTRVHFPDTVTYCSTWRKSLKHSRSLH